MAEDALPPEIGQAIERLNELVTRFEQHPEEMVRERVFDLLRCVDLIHRSGVRRVAELLTESGASDAALASPPVALLLEMYNGAPAAEKARAEAVLADLREGIESYGGTLQVPAAESGAVTVRLLGSFPPEMLAALRVAVEQRLREGMPGFVRVDVETPQPPRPRSFVPLTTLGVSKKLLWQEVVPAEQVPEDALLPVEVQGERLILARVEGEVFAYRDACPGTPFPLQGGHVQDRQLRCPYHGCLFDLRGGRRLDRSGAGLGVVPVRVQDGQVRIAIPSGMAA